MPVATFDEIVQHILFERGEILTPRFRDTLGDFGECYVGRSFIRRYLEAFILFDHHKLPQVRKVKRQLHDAFLAIHFRLNPGSKPERALARLKDLNMVFTKQANHRVTAGKMAEMLMLILGEHRSLQYVLTGRKSGRNKDRFADHHVFLILGRHRKYLWVLATAILSSDLEMFHFYLEYFRRLCGLCRSDEETYVQRSRWKWGNSEVNWNLVLDFCLLLSLQKPKDSVFILRILNADRKIFGERLGEGDGCLNERAYSNHIIEALQIQHIPTRHIALQLLLGFSSIWHWPDIVGGILSEAARINDRHIIDLVIKSIQDHGIQDCTWESTQRRRYLYTTKRGPFPYDRPNAMVICIYYGHWGFLNRLLETSKQLGPALHRFSGEDDQIALRFWISTKPSIENLDIAEKMLVLFNQDCLGVELGWIAAHHSPETLAAFAPHVDLRRPCCQRSTDVLWGAGNGRSPRFIEFQVWKCTHTVHARFAITNIHRKDGQCAPSSISIGQCMLVMAIRHLQLENARMLVEDHSIRITECPNIARERSKENELRLEQLNTMLVRNQMLFTFEFQTPKKEHRG